MSAIIDSGACSCLMDLYFAARHLIPLQTKTQGLSVHLANGSTIKSGLITQEIIPLLTTIASHHQELLCLDVISSPLFPIILGIPSTYCHQHCLQEAPGNPSPLLYLDYDSELRQSAQWFVAVS